MSLWFESIKVYNRKLFNIDYHNQRVNRTRKDLLGLKKQIHLQDLINIPDHLSDDLHKCKVFYSDDINKIEFTPYQLKKIKNLKVVQHDAIEYDYKSSDRKVIEELLRQKEKCDDILIVKNNMLTDASFANVVFYDGTKWITPANPLLKGTKREQLLNEGKIYKEEITLNDLKLFSKVILINAMLDLKKELAINVEDIHY